jgi:hypothetical protein
VLPFISLGQVGWGSLIHELMILAAGYARLSRRFLRLTMIYSLIFLAAWLKRLPTFTCISFMFLACASQCFTTILSPKAAVITPVKRAVKICRLQWAEIQRIGSAFPRNAGGMSVSKHVMITKGEGISFRSLMCGSGR